MKKYWIQAFFIYLIFSAQQAIAKDKYLVVDSFDSKTDSHLSLDVNTEIPEVFRDMKSDLVYTGVVQSSENNPSKITIKIANSVATKLSLKRIQMDENTYQVYLDGMPISVEEGEGLKVELLPRSVPNTKSVRRITGRSENGRLLFTVTDDPIPAVVGVIAVGIGLVCGSSYLIDTFREDCAKDALEQCGKGKVKSFMEESLLGFKWDKGAKIGCGKECKIECNQ